MEGKAKIVRDRKAFEQHWVKDLERWFADGVDTEGLTLIEVKAERIAYWAGEDNGEVVLDGSNG